ARDADVSIPRDRVQGPFVGHALQGVPAPILEEDPGPRDEVPHRLRREHLGRRCLGAHPCGDVHRDPADLAGDRLDLARMHARPPLGPPARTRGPGGTPASAIACAQRIPRAGPSTVAMTPPPAVSTSVPRYRASRARTIA